MSLPFLETLGLTKNEANLYELLLRKGEVPVGDLIRETNLPRATAYKTLASLEKKGLVIQKDIDKKIHARPEPPSKLLALAEDQSKALERAREDVHQMLPEMTSAYTLSVERPIISSFEGLEGIKKVYEDIIAQKQNILLFRSLYDEQIPELSKLLQLQIKRQVAARIHVRTITPLTKDTKQTYEKQDQKRLVERHVVYREDYRLPAQIMVYGTKVAIISLKKNIITTLIDNPDIADTFRRLFQILWDLTEAEHQEITKDWKQEQAIPEQPKPRPQNDTPTTG